MDRRSFLGRSGTVAFSTLAVYSGNSAADRERVTDSDAAQNAEQTEQSGTLRERARIPADVEDTFDTVLNVQELGADPNGEQPITSLIEDAAADDTLLVFPEGRYRMGWIGISGVSNFGIVSMEGTQPTLVPTEPGESMGDWFLTLQGEDLLLNGFDLDFTAPGHGARTQVVTNTGDFWCGNIHVRGQIESSADAFCFMALDEDSTGTVERLIARDGSASDDGPSVGIYIGLDHAGAIHINDCEMWHFQGKGIYGSGPAERKSGAGGGTIHVDGGLYKNNNPANIRLGGGSTIRNVTFRNEDTLEGESVTWEHPLPKRRGIVNARSVRVKGDRNGPVVIEDCDFYHEVGFGSAVITVTPTGGAVVRDCNIEVVGEDIPAVYLKPDRTDLPPCTFEGMSITGAERDAPLVRVRGRDDPEFHDCSITGPGSSGFRLSPDSDVSLLETQIDVGKEEVWVAND